MQIVLDALRKISKYAIEHPIAFRKKVEELFAVKQVATIAETRQRLKRLNKRRDELHIMVQKLYESYALEKISEEQFALMMVDYTKEQAEVKAQIAADEQEIAAYGEDANRADQFLAVVNRFMNFEKLTGEMLHSYVERIYVHPKERAPGVCTQQVDIHFKFIGAFPVPVPEPTPEEIAAEEARRKRSIKAHEKYLRQKPHIQAREKAKREAWKKAREAEQASS